MTTVTQLASERFPDTTLPSVLPLPSPPLTADDCVRYIRQLHVILNMNQTRLAEIMRIVSYHRSTVSTDDDTGLGGEATGGTDSMPPATGSGVQHADVDRVTGAVRMFVDTINDLGNPEWFEVNPIPDEAMREFAFADAMPNKYLSYVGGVLDLMEIYDDVPTKRYEKQFNYVGGVLDNIVLTRMSDSETWTKTLTYVGGVLEEIEVV